MKPLNIALSHTHEISFGYPLEPASLTPLLIAHTHTGTSQSSGRLHITFLNALNETHCVTYLKTPPWFIKFYLYTLILTINNDPCPRDDILQELTYIPTTANYPTLLEPTLLLPPLSVVHLMLSFNRSFLQYMEHPLDIQQGWDLLPMVLVPLAPDAMNGLSVLPQMYTLMLLVDLVTPDFSMPYNVIIMSSMLMALLFGSIFNLLTRSFVAVRIN